MFVGKLAGIFCYDQWSYVDTKIRPESCKLITGNGQTTTLNPFPRGLKRVVFVVTQTYWNLVYLIFSISEINMKYLSVVPTFFENKRIKDCLFRNLTYFCIGCQ